MRQTKLWPDRVVWGVLFDGFKGEPTKMIGGGWHPELRGARYDGEPTRPLLFTSRRLARVWCQEQRAKYADRPDFVREWRFRPVRLRESWRLA